MKAVVDAVYQDGVFKPVRPPDISDGEHVRIMVESVGQARRDDILQLAARVYAGLSPNEIDEIEEMARHRTLFTNAQP